MNAKATNIPLRICKLIIKLCFIFIVFITLACQEIVDLEVETSAPLLVVDGLITTERKQHEVRLGQTADYGLKEYPPATNAFVTISDENNTFQMSEISDGVYITDDSIAGEVGKVYTLRIAWSGNVYQAMDTLPEVTDFEPIFFGEGFPNEDFEFRRHQFGFSEANRWEQWVTRTEPLPGNVNPSSLGQQIGVSFDIDNGYVFNWFTHPKIEVSGVFQFEETHFYGFRGGNRVAQRKFSLSDQHYAFWRTVFLETEWRGSLFDTEPTNVITNVSNGAVGFFGASAVIEKTWMLN